MFQESSIDILIKKGAPRSKLALGIPLYGRIFQLKNRGRDVRFGEPTVKGAGLVGPYVKEPGVYGYNEVSLCRV